MFDNAFNQLLQDVQDVLKDNKIKLKNWFKRFVILPFLIKFYINQSPESKNMLLNQVLTIEDVNNSLNDKVYISALAYIKQYINVSKLNLDVITKLLLNVFNIENFIKFIIDYLNNDKKVDLAQLGIRIANEVYNTYNPE